MTEQNKPHVLLLNGSPHAAGCTYTALKEVADTLEASGVTAEIIQVGNRDIRGCIACGTCGRTGRCVFDDEVNVLLEKLAAADGLVVGSPVYYASANGTLTALLDRLFYANHTDLSMKVGASVVSCRRGGASATFDQLNKYFTISGMPVASSQYWNSVHGFTAEDVKRDLEGLQTMRVLARNMAFLIKAIRLGKSALGLPEKEVRHAFTSFMD